MFDPRLEPPESLTLRMSDGVSIHVACDRPSATPSAASTPAARPLRVVMLHGLQSHAGWYGWSARFLADRGVEVWRVDRRGSGRSGGPRGHARAADRLVADVAAICREAAADGHRVVLMGLCWGGKLAVAAAASGLPLAGLVLLYPALATRFDASLRQRALLRLGRAIGLATRPVASPLRPEHFTDVVAARQAIAEDPFSTRTITVAMAAVDRELTREMPNLIATVTAPSLVVLGERDRISRNGRIAELAATMRGPRTLRHIELASHVLEFEPTREEIFAGVVDWLEHLADGAFPGDGDRDDVGPR